MIVEAEREHLAFQLTELLVLALGKAALEVKIALFEKIPYHIRADITVHKIVNYDLALVFDADDRHIGVNALSFLGAVLKNDLKFTAFVKLIKAAKNLTYMGNTAV
jgi:hypothetical protein